MTAPLWQPGTQYAPGFIVRATTAPAPVASQVVNGTFESGDTGWTKGTGWAINTTEPFQGTYSAEYDATGTANLDSTTSHAVTPGQSITATCMVQQGASSSGQAGATVKIIWLTSGDVEISVADGNTVDSASGGAWKQSTVTAVAPATAAKAKIRVTAFRLGGGASLWVDNVQWNLFTPAAPSGLLFKAVQSAVGTSGPVEPVWPSTNGVQVTDNSVVWEAIGDTRIVWTARPILESGATEPTWSTVPGELVPDGDIGWKCVVRNITDENCPNTEAVVIMASKVFAGDEDIVRFSATANPLDWTTEQDAGYLPTGLQQANANDVAVLAPYRGNLAVFNAACFQAWQADPDPAVMAILDQMDGIGSTWPRAAVAVADELLFLSALGVRTVSISGGNESLTAGDIGMPIDPLVQEAVAELEDEGGDAIGTYYPALGQYWLAFAPGVPGAGITISGQLPQAYIGIAIEPFTYTVTGGTGPFTFSIDLGALPTGLTLNASTGEVTGTPTVAGTYAWRVRVVDSLSLTDTVDNGIDIAEGIDGGSPFEVTRPAPSLVTDVNSYQGRVSALSLGGSLGVFGSSNLVRVSPNGLYSAVSHMNGTSTDYFRIVKYDTATQTWSILPDPANKPSRGPQSMIWADDETLIIAFDENFTNDWDVWVYSRTGDTFTRVSAIDDNTLASPVSRSIAIDADRSRVVIGEANTANTFNVYDFDGTSLTGRRGEANTGAADGDNRVAFRSDLSVPYVAAANANVVEVYADSGSAITLVDSVAASGQHGLYWRGNYLFAVGFDGVTTYSISVIEFDPGAGALTIKQTLVVADAIGDSSITIDGSYIALTGDGPRIYTLSSATPPVVAFSYDAPSLAGVESVSFSEVQL